MSARSATLGHERGHLEQFARDILAGVDFLAQLLSPGRNSIDPALDRVFVATRRPDGKDGRPSVVAERFHRDRRPLCVTGAMIEQRGRYRVVAVGKDVRGDDDPIARRPLDRKPPIVDPRADALDDDAADEGRVECRINRGSRAGLVFVVLFAILLTKQKGSRVLGSRVPENRQTARISSRPRPAPSPRHAPGSP